ncbi:immunoglobulin J chain isoform X1 [Pseudophryne corroboree]|uniref:immunoglobulin J chain isoform X1 n=1 Tax=Pseudophryne corroboree TaxID=495146 RepID=UPI0030814E52
MVLTCEMWQRGRAWWSLNTRTSQACTAAPPVDISSLKSGCTCAEQMPPEWSWAPFAPIIGAQSHLDILIRRGERMEKHSLLLAAAVLLFAVYVTGQYPYDDQYHVLVDNKCKCVKVTSRFVKTEDNKEILERNIEIKVPMRSRVNISDPTSPLRTNFVYKLSDLCKKCDPVEMDIGGEPTLVSQGSCSKSDDICYTYDRNKCYTNEVPFTYNGKTIMKKVALTPESCYE